MVQADVKGMELVSPVHWIEQSQIRLANGDFYAFDERPYLINPLNTQARSGMFGAYGGVLITERQIEELRGQIKRWTWRGRPTRRVRRLNNLERQESRYLALSRPYLSR